MRMNALEWTLLVLIIVGAVNWGLVGFFGFDLVAALFGNMTAMSRFIYALVGVAAVTFAAMMPVMSRKGQ